MKLALLMLLASAPELQSALENERASLQAERRSLQERLKSLRVERARLEQTEMNEIRELAGRVEAARSEAQAIESAVASRSDDAPVPLTALIEEVREVLGADGLQEEASVEKILARAVDDLALGRRVRRAPGRFFSSNGQPVDGEILFAGALAAYGSGPGEAAGPLSRVGEDWALVERADVGALFRASGEPVVPLVLGGLSEGEREPKGWKARIELGGGLAVPILGLGLLVALVALERIFALTRISRGDDALERALVDLLDKGAMKKVESLVEAGRTGVARIARASLQRPELGLSARSELTKSVLVEELARTERRLPLLKLVAAAAPLLGLLGTVMGMIETFEVISVYGSGDATLLSGGISKALVTTQLGLLVAVPTLFVHGALCSWSDRIGDRLERCARDLPALVARDRGSE